MAWHVLYRLKAEETIYRMVYHTYRLYRFLVYKSILKPFFYVKNLYAKGLITSNQEIMEMIT
jgi:hypothetical protein